MSGAATALKITPEEFDRLTLEEQVELAAEKLLGQAVEARKDSCKFYAFVMKEETTKDDIRTQPFQRVLFKFVNHFNRCVVRMPVGFGKTYTMAALSLELLGADCTTRGAIISASKPQAQKPLKLVSDYIQTSQELRMVYPELVPSDRDGDQWTQTAITVKRPPGIRDPSLVAVGFHGKLPGSRLNWILVDDIMTQENTETEEQRLAIHSWFYGTVLNRRDIQGSKIVVTNTPWHPKDLTYTLEEAGWPTLTVDVFGNIFFSNTCATDLVPGAELPEEGEFDCDDIRPSHIHFPVDDEGRHIPVADTRKLAYRLTAHDTRGYVETANDNGEYFDELDDVPLWPERFSVAAIASLKNEYRNTMHKFNQAYRCVVRDDDASRVKQAWIDACKAEARARGIHSYVSSWNINDGRTFTGVDLASGKKKRNDLTSIFTFAVTPDKYRRILRIDSGRYGEGRIIVDLVAKHHEMFHSIVRVESNGAQEFLRQQLRDTHRQVPVRGSVTGRNKMNREHGVESLFIEVENIHWLIPNDGKGGVDEPTQRWIDSMLYYNPQGHTGDELMAAWLAREQARESGALRMGSKDGPTKSAAAMGVR